MKMNRNSVFIVKCYNLDLAAKDDRIKRSRTWGFFHEEKTATTCVLENWTDIFENRYYNFAVVMEMPIGVCVSPIKYTWFFIDEDDSISIVNFDPINENRGGPGKYRVGW